MIFSFSSFSSGFCHHCETGVLLADDADAVQT